MYEGLDQKTILAAEKALDFQMLKDKMIKVIDKFVQEIDPEIEVEEGDEFESDVFNKVVYAAIDEYFFVYEDEVLHQILLKEKGYNLEISLQMFSILHEIGHIMTISKYKDKLDKAMEYDRLRFNLIKTHKNSLNLLREYKKLDLEVDADEYAYAYYQENKEKVLELDKKLWSMATNHE